MRIRQKARVAAVVAATTAALGLMIVTGAPADALSGPMVSNAGCTANVLPRNDDQSTGVVDLPFNLDLYGHNYGSLFVNNNGNVTFTGALSTYVPFAITANTPPIITAFLADVDTRNPASSQVTYGATTVGSRPAFCVNWDLVGYYNNGADKLNSFQLLLVSRSDIGAGDFDIFFNYGSIQWQAGGTKPAGIGFSAGDGDPNHYFELPNSADGNDLRDTDAATGLIHNSRGSLSPGQYVFPVRNGNDPGSATATGQVTGPGGVAQGAAAVQVCPTAGTSCVVGTTNSSGQYTIPGLAPGSYTTSANPPAGSNLTPATSPLFTVTEGQTATVDLTLDGPTPPPMDTSISNGLPSSNGIPVIFWARPSSLDTVACTGGSSTYRIVLQSGAVRTGGLTESPAGSGRYHTDIPAFYPEHGNAQIQIVTTCPNGPNESTAFDIYIDPSGNVVDTAGNAVQGATVTLTRSDSATGPFTAVPNGSAIMSPSNRTNPVTTPADGSFHWDVVAGFYQLMAAKTGCGTTTSTVYAVPPPALNIQLMLNCPTTPSGTGVMKLLPTSAKPGAATIVSLMRMPANARVALSLDNGRTLKTINSYAGGDAYTQLTIPRTTGLGAHQVTAKSGSTTASAPISITSQCVTAPPPGASRAVRDAYTAALITGNAC